MKKLETGRLFTHGPVRRVDLGAESILERECPLCKRTICVLRGEFGFRYEYHVPDPMIPVEWCPQSGVAYNNTQKLIP